MIFEISRSIKLRLFYFPPNAPFRRQTEDGAFNSTERMENKKETRTNFINILNISSSIVSLAGFMIMMAGLLNEKMNWIILIKYIAQALAITGTCSLVVYAIWRIIIYNRRKKNIANWCIFPIYCLAALFITITFVEISVYISDFFVFWINGHD